MTLLSFAFSPVFLSVMAFCIILLQPLLSKKNTQQTYSIDLNMFFCLLFISINKGVLNGKLQYI